MGAAYEERLGELDGRQESSREKFEESCGQLEKRAATLATAVGEHHQDFTETCESLNAKITTQASNLIAKTDELKLLTKTTLQTANDALMEQVSQPMTNLLSTPSADIRSGILCSYVLNGVDCR